MKRTLLILGLCLLLLGCRTGGEAVDYRDAVAVDLALATMTDDAAPQPHRCTRCKDTGWITHGDGHRTPCPDCQGGSSGSYGGPLDTLRDAKNLIRKGNELADRSKTLLDAAERSGKITIDVHLPKAGPPPLPIEPGPLGVCPSGGCPLVPNPVTAPPAQAASSRCRTSCSRPRLFGRWRR